MHPSVQLQLLHIFFYIGICFGQIVFPRNSICTTPDRENGNCVRWSQCLSLSRKISDWEHLRPYLCGFAGTEPKVCCPSSNKPDIPRQDDRISSTVNHSRDLNNAPEAKSGEHIPGIDPPGSRNNRNEKPNFLPDDCGSSIFTNIRVIGGQKAEKGSWPWMAVVFKLKRGGTKSADCGGALVTARHVVTAAHCVTVRNSITPLELDRLMVRLGVHDLTDENDLDAIDVEVDAVRIHENYDPRILMNDIAVLRLIRPVQFSNTTAPVCLPYDSLRYDDLSGKSSTVTGFGSTSDSGPYSDVLMEVSFDIQEQEMCKRTYKRTVRITDLQMCAGTLDGTKDSCLGDSGGPLVTVGKEKRYYLVGIVSFGKLQCAQPGYPGVYTRVTAYLDWLKPKLAD